MEASCPASRRSVCACVKVSDSGWLKHHDARWDLESSASRLSDRHTLIWHPQHTKRLSIRLLQAVHQHVVGPRVGSACRGVIYTPDVASGGSRRGLTCSQRKCTASEDVNGLFPCSCGYCWA